MAENQRLQLHCTTDACLWEVVSSDIEFHLYLSCHQNVVRALSSTCAEERVTSCKKETNLQNHKWVGFQHLTARLYVAPAVRGACSLVWFWLLQEESCTVIKHNTWRAAKECA